MSWKNFLYALLGILIPSGYAWLKSKYPSFPLGEEHTTTLLLWTIGMLIGGWNSKTFISSCKNYLRR